jgi:two-component system, cell cycle response regulator
MRVLIADDSIVSRHVLEAALRKWSYEPVPAANGNEAWAILQSDDAPQLAILDWMMPGLTGLELCRLVRQRAKEPYTYILLLTARSESGDIIEGMDAGADDYITKPFDYNELKVRLRAGRRIVELHAQLLAAREALRDQATRDSLTRIWNRASILEMLETEIQRSSRELRPLGVVMFDLDHFKQVNDTYGHLAGDVVLREMAQRVHGTLRAYDAIGRYGGEEFLIVLPGCDQHATEAQAERTRHIVSCDTVDVGNAQIHISASFGASAFLPGKPVSSHELMRSADEALYRAKDLGRNRVVFLPSSEETADLSARRIR